jgi:hypothetical protein
MLASSRLNHSIQIGIIRMFGGEWLGSGIFRCF